MKNLITFLILAMSILQAHASCMDHYAQASREAYSKKRFEKSKRLSFYSRLLSQAYEFHVHGKVDQKIFASKYFKKLQEQTLMSQDDILTSISLADNGEEFCKDSRLMTKNKNFIEVIIKQLDK